MENILTPNLEQVLASILQSLANFFGTTTEAVIANFPDWLAKYGWYTMLWHDLPCWIFGGILLGIAFSFLFTFLNDFELKTGGIIVTILLFLLGFSIIVIIPFIACYIAPEFVGLEALLELISNK